MKGHLDEDQQSKTDAFRIETSTKPVDIAVLLKALEPLAGRCGRQADLVRKVDRRDPTISLQNRENSAIQTIKSHSYVGLSALLPLIIRQSSQIAYRNPGKLRLSRVEQNGVSP